MEMENKVQLTEFTHNKIMCPQIEESLQDVIVDEYTSAIFECKVSTLADIPNSTEKATWYKDGKLIEHSRRTKISFEDECHRLEITSVKVADQGVYCIILKNASGHTFSKSNLFVNPIRGHSQDGVIYTSSCSRNNFGVVRHLLSTTVLVGQTIELEAEFKSDSIEDFVWYKSNQPLQFNSRIITLNDRRTTTLSILHAEEADSGTYLVVTQTKYGLTASFADVLVIDTDLNTLVNAEIVPSIEEMPDELEAYEREEVRLMCKAKFDSNTISQWSKNGVPISDRDNVIIENGHRYTCLRIEKPKLIDMGEYTVLLRDTISNRCDSASCFLTINPASKENIPIVKLKKCLDSVIACFGSKVTFTCSFTLEDPKYYFVVWYIGHFRVERTNHRFHVVGRGGDYLLHIKQVEPGMSGEVVCELRRALPNRRSMLINTSTAVLTLAPSAIIDKAKKLHTVIPKRFIFNVNSKITIPFKTHTQTQNGHGLSKLSINSSNGSDDVCDKPKTIMKINYCRLEDGRFYIDISNGQSEVPINYLMVYEKTVRTLNNDTRIVVIEWTKFNSCNVWYQIEMQQANNEFAIAGVSTQSVFEVVDPPVGKILMFRIITMEPSDDISEAAVCIRPAGNYIQKVFDTSKLKPTEEFEKLFTKTGDLIGCGAFGSVVLVRDATGEHYAAKILKTRTQKKRDTALREFDMMKRLHHPKLVQLVDSFIGKDSFVFVMDYLWGGELFDRIVEEEHIKEVDVVPYVRQICEALNYLHVQKIAHLDLKPENIICLSPNTRQVKIIDFGLARVLEEGHVTRAIYGTRDYVAPEVLNFEQLTLACDMWSLGVVTYMLLSGVMPFGGDSWPERSANITRANYNYHESAFKEISDLAKDFVDHLLVLHPDKRMKASVALNHQWILEGPPRGAKAGHMKRARENLKSYLANYRARWQRAGNVMIAAHRLRTHASAQRASGQPDHASPRIT